MRRKLSTAIHQTFNKYGITFVGKYHQDQPFIAAFQQTCKYVNLNQSKFGKSTKMENTLPFALGSIVKMGCIFQMRISNQDGNGKDIQIKTLQQIGIDICKAIDLTTAPQLIKEFPKFQQQMDISDSESCHSFDENTQNKKRIIKRKLTTINTGNENNLSIATTTTTKKSFLPSKLKPLGDISQYQTSNKKPIQSSQFKTRVRSFSTRAPDFYLKN